jgi:hypothetical protein
VRCFAGEESSEDCCIKKTNFNRNKIILFSAAIFYDGQEELYFVDEKENKEVYGDILDEYLPNIPILQSGELIFEQYNAPPHTPL